MTDSSEAPAGPPDTVRTRIMTEFRRAPDGLDPDDVYAYVVRLQARIDFLEGQVRELKSAALLDEMLKQAAEIRLQALDAAERTWLDIVQAADAEAARRRDEAMRDARRLLEDACAGIRGIHDRLQAPAVADAPVVHHRFPGPDLELNRPAPDTRDKPRPSDVTGQTTPTHQDALTDGSALVGAEVEPPFRLPAWIEE